MIITNMIMMAVVMLLQFLINYDDGDEDDRDDSNHSHDHNDNSNLAGVLWTRTNEV